MRSRRKINIAHRSARFVNNLTQGKSSRFEMRLQSFISLTGQSREQVIFGRLGRSLQHSLRNF